MPVVNLGSTSINSEKTIPYLEPIKINISIYAIIEKWISCEPNCFSKVKDFL